MKRNYLKIGDKVEMKDGSILTIKKLDYHVFTATETATYQNKNEIVKIL